MIYVCPCSSSLTSPSPLLLSGRLCLLQGVALCPSVPSDAIVEPRPWCEKLVQTWRCRETFGFFFFFLFLHIPEESPVVLVLGSFPVISPGSISLEGNSSWFNCISIIGRCGVGVVAARRLVPLRRRTACTWIKWSLVCTTELLFRIHYVVFPFSFHFLQPRVVWFVDQRLLERTFLAVLYCDSFFKRHKILSKYLKEFVIFPDWSRFYILHFITRFL